MSALNNLLFRISLIDHLSGPANNMMNNMNRATSGIQSGLSKIGYGAAGLAAAAYSLENIVQPAKEMQTALGGISSLGVGQQVLDGLSKAAMDFSSRYGESAVEFVNSSYAIQSAIAGLTGNDLSAFTTASAILAKGTKADVGAITDYVGTMYGVFKGSADGMGKSKWVEQLAGQTALSVKIFKTTGQAMSEGFSGLSGASSAPLAEQLSILGQLQAVKHGSEAGTLYKAFLAGVGKSQKELGLNFTDPAGKLLPMVDILTKITGKFGSLEKQSTRDLLTTALGGTEAMSLVDILAKDIGGLNANITEIGKQTGMQQAIVMAKAMTMPWDRAKESVTNLRIAIGDKLLVAMTPLYNKITDVSETLRRWTGLFPNITKYIGYAVFGIIGMTAALAALSIIVGVGSIVTAGFGLAWSAIAFILTPLAPLLTAVRMAWMVMKMEMLAGSGVFAALKIGLSAFASQLLINVSAIWAWNVALFTNPITLWILGVSAVVGLVAAAIIYWDTWTQAVISFSAKWLELIGVFALVDNAIAGWEVLKGWWQGFKNYLSSLNPFAVVGAGIDWLISKINMIPGVHIATGGADNPALSAMSGPQTSSPALSAMAAQPQWLQQPAPGLLSDGFAPPQPVAPPASLSQSQTANVPKGGIMSQVNNANNSKSVSVGGIYITNPTRPITGQFLSDELQMAAG